jgi:DNA-binding ferritin-like protein (Dps family)
MLKKVIFYLYLVLRKLNNKYTSQPIVFIADSLEEKDIDLLINQIKWYLYDIPVQVYVKDNKTVNIDNIQIIKELPRDYYPIYTSYKTYFSFRSLRNKFNGLIIDRNFYLANDAITFRDLYFRFANDQYKDKLENISKINYKKFVEKKDSDVSTCFLTGPSIEKYKDVDICTDGYKIVCNSIVKNKELLEHIKGPDIVVFADPVFHFSINDYCEKFRNDLIKVFDKYKPFIGVPIQSMPVYLNNFPFLEDYLIGFESSKEIIFPTLLNNLQVKSTGNILTMLMIPIAISRSKKLHQVQYSINKKE